MIGHLTDISLTFITYFIFSSKSADYWYMSNLGTLTLYSLIPITRATKNSFSFWKSLSTTKPDYQSTTVYKWNVLVLGHRLNRFQSSSYNLSYVAMRRSSSTVQKVNGFSLSNEATEQISVWPGTIRNIIAPWLELDDRAVHHCHQHRTYFPFHLKC